MGTLIYGPGTRYEFEDRELAHIKIAIAVKLRWQESFLLNWVVPRGEGSGRVSLWISPAMPLQFQFTGSRPPALNKAWLDALAVTSHRTGGMQVMAEEDAESFIRDESGQTPFPG
jgi:hypothetical protein